MPQRIEELDALRGLMLVWITCTHLPTVLSTYVNQPFGFFAATEGFIFLSALFTGRIYFRIAERDGSGAMWRKLWTRAGKLYCYQLLLLAFAFVIEAPIAAHGNTPAVHNLLDFYFTASHTRAFIDAALMLYRPPLLDILPIYIILLALTPLALMLGERFGWKYAIAGGFTLWLLAQFGFRSFVYHVQSRAFGLRIPLNEMGAFDLWAWQLWWLVGLWLGVRWAKDDFRLDWVKRMTIPAAIAAIFFLILRYAQMTGVLTFGKSGLLLDKWDFGVGRMIDFTAVGVLAIRSRSALSFFAIRPLVMLGQASLPVFCVHLLCVFFALTIMGNDPIIRDWKAIVVILTSLTALLLTARIAANRRANSGGNRAAKPKLPTPPPAGYQPGLATQKVV
ncbi:MAG: OpgC protein [Candidatus Sulfotelmatobacter sp.]|nr:OpgC protein [Candidatus Sulfotelmatobacter sp.]